MASMGHPSSRVAAILSLIPLRKWSVLDPGRVSSIYELSSAILMLFFVINHLGNKLPSCLSASGYVNSPTRRNPAKDKVNAARRVMLS